MKLRKAIDVLAVLFTFFLTVLHVRANNVSQTNERVVKIVLDPDLSHIMRRVNERFLSVTIDASFMTEEKFMYLLGSPKLRTLARALAPGFLRFGGTKQDFMTFKPQSEFVKLEHHHRNSLFFSGEDCERFEIPPLLEARLLEEWAFQASLLQKEELEGNYKRIKFSEYAVDLLNSFANCSGLDLIFGLNALLRKSDNSWDSQNAVLLMDYCQSRQYNMSWELGNEPNSYEKKAGIRLDGFQLGQDFLHLRKILQQSKMYHSTGLYGPDISQPRDHRRDLLTGFLESGAEAIDACTWHHYYVNGRETSLEDFLDPELFDTLAVKTSDFQETVQMIAPGKKLWLGETSSAYGGGAVGLSDSFAAGFMWLDKLGLAATLGLDVVMRQVLVGSGSYHLVDENLDPLPDYWLSVLYKRLVGPEVLRVKTHSTSGLKKKLRIYLHCTNTRSFRRGAVTLFALNLSWSPARLTLPPHVSNSSVEAFVLQSAVSGEEGLYSKSVRLNGEVLKMVDDRTLPPLRGSKLPSGQPLQLPGLSFAFFVLEEAHAPACR